MLGKVRRLSSFLQIQAKSDIADDSHSKEREACAALGIVSSKKPKSTVRRP